MIDPGFNPEGALQSSANAKNENFNKSQLFLPCSQDLMRLVDSAVNALDRAMNSKDDHNITDGIYSAYYLIFVIKCVAQNEENVKIPVIEFSKQIKDSMTTCPLNSLVRNHVYSAKMSLYRFQHCGFKARYELIDSIRSAEFFLNHLIAN